MSFESVLCTMMDCGITEWDNERIPPPVREEMALRCYAEAIWYAQKTYLAKMRNVREASLPQEPPTREQFTYLLFLFQVEEWFKRRDAEETLLSERQRPESVTRREGIAREVIARANRRLGWPEQSSFSGRLPVDAVAERRFLEDLQAAWGVGWILAIPAIKYEWPV